MAGKGKNRKIQFIGNHRDDEILIGNYGNTAMKVEGTFELSGIVYAPRYTVILSVEGTGKISLGGICRFLIIRKLHGNCTLDISQLSCKELKCQSMRDKALVIAGRVRVVSEANLDDDAILFLKEKPLILNPVLSGNSQVHLTAFPQTELNKI
jgi:hypothetical protein